MFFNVPCSATETITTPIEAKSITHVFFQPKNDRLWLADTDESGAIVSIMIDGKQICKDLFILPFCTQSPTATCNFRWEDVAIEVNLNVNLSEIKITKKDTADYDTDDYDVVFVCSDKEVDESKGFEFFETKAVTWCNDDVDRNFLSALKIEYDNTLLALKEEKAEYLNSANAEKNAANAAVNAANEAKVEEVKTLSAGNKLRNERNTIINEANTELNKSISAHNAANAALRTALADTSNADNVAAANSAFATLNSVNSDLNTYNTTRNSKNVQWNKSNATRLQAYSIEQLPTNLKTDYSTSYPTALGSTDAWPDSVDADEALAATNAPTDYQTLESDALEVKEGVEYLTLPTYEKLPTNLKTDYQATDTSVEDALRAEIGVSIPEAFTGNEDILAQLENLYDVYASWYLEEDEVGYFDDSNKIFLIELNFQFGGENLHYDKVAYEVIPNFRKFCLLDGRFVLMGDYTDNGGSYSTIDFASTFWNVNSLPKTQNVSFDAFPTLLFAYNVMQINPAGRYIDKQTTQFMRDNFVNSTIDIDGAENEVIPNGSNIGLISATNHIPMRQALYQIPSEAGLRKNATIKVSLPSFIRLRHSDKPNSVETYYDNRGQIPIGDPCFWRTYFFFGYRKIA